MITEKLDRLALEPHPKWVKAHGRHTASEEHEPTACREYAVRARAMTFESMLNAFPASYLLNRELPLKSQHLVIWGRLGRNLIRWEH